jgi:uncharacterized RDD family membrane protein YckC
MKCPKCGFQSFNHLTTCKKCGRSLSDLKDKLGFSQSGWSDTAAAPHDTETGSSRDEMSGKAPVGESAREESLEDFFRSFENSPEENRPGNAGPGDFPPEPAPEPFPLGEDAESDDQFFPFGQIDSDLEGLQQSEEESTELFALDNPFDKEEEPEAVAAPAPAPAVELEGSPEEEFPDTDSEKDDFYSFADLDAELDTVEEAPELGFDADGERIAGLEETPPINPEDSAREIEQAMAEDSAGSHIASAALSARAEARTDQALDEFPFSEEFELAEEAPGRSRSLLRLRLLAGLTDLGILSAVFGLFVAAGEMARLPDRDAWFQFSTNSLLDLAAPYFLVLFTLCFGYFTLFHYLTGQTPGKMLWRVRVEGEAGSSLTFSQAFLHSVGGLAALLPAGLGFLSMLTNDHQRGWNDRLANSRVVTVPDKGMGLQAGE